MIDFLTAVTASVDDDAETVDGTFLHGQLSSQPKHFTQKSVVLRLGVSQRLNVLLGNDQEVHGSLRMDEMCIRDRLKPVTKGYRWVTPQFVQDGVSNAIDNLGEVNNTLNNVLQGKVDQGITSAFRFMLNSTIGVFGLFDVATWVGMERAPEDFGQTLGVWGVPEGPYFELPLLGPSGGRDIFKWPVQTATNPITYLTWDEWEWSTAYAVVDAVDTRSRMMDAGLDDMRANVVDEYVAIRDAYRQSRRMAVADGQIDEDAQRNSLCLLYTSRCV